MSSTAQRFVLTGPHQGKTMHVNGREFINGEFVFIGGQAEIQSLGNLLSYYGVKTEQQAELDDLRAKHSVAVTLPTADDFFVRQAADELMAAELRALEKPPIDLSLTPADAMNGLPSLAEAVGSLDPDVDTHWTSNNLPSLDYLLALTGQKASRAEVDAVADGYTRTKARAARA